MKDYNKDETLQCYELTAEAYADAFASELSNKPYDRYILQRFAECIPPDGRVLELASGPGHVSAYLSELGLKNIHATDISGASVAVGRRLYPKITFSTADMRNTGFADKSFDGIVCAYGIVHFTYEEIKAAFAEWKRIIRPGGHVLLSFHVGKDESVTVEKFLNVDAARGNWNFFEPEKVLRELEASGAKYEEMVVRYPYLGREHASHRCYILARYSA